MSSRWSYIKSKFTVSSASLAKQRRSARYLSCAAVLLSLVACSGDSGDTPDLSIGKGYVEKTVPDYADDALVAADHRLATTIVRVLEVGDAELANHPRGFRLFSIYLHPDFSINTYDRLKKQNVDKVAVSSVKLNYFRPVRSGWENLEIDFPSAGRIAVTVSLNDARNGPPPDPAPADMPATEGALLRLVRSSPAGYETPPSPAHPSPRRQQVRRSESAGYESPPGFNARAFRLTKGGSDLRGREASSPEGNEHDFFIATSPRGKWLWWTVVVSPIGVRDGQIQYKREFIYVDAITGAATSRCATSTGSPAFNPLVAIPCK